MKRLHLSTYIHEVGVILLLCGFLVALTSCLQPSSTVEPLGEQGSSTAVTSSDAATTAGAVDESDLITYNVTFTGILEEGGMTIYQQGTHRLVLSDGRMVLLEVVKDNPIPLEIYLGKLVRVSGDVMPTVEAGGTLLRVKSIGWLRRETVENGDTIEVYRVLCGGAEGATCPKGFSCRIDGEEGMCVKESVEEDVEEPEEVEESEDDPEEVAASASSVAVTEEGEDEEEEESEEEGFVFSDEADMPELGVLPADLEEMVTRMMNEDYADERWTQEYCSSHVEFCIRIHRNWWYKSFGATASLLWHVEMGGGAVNQFGDGPISVDLKSGSLDSLGLHDGAVRIIGNEVIGYREWTDNRHFEISGVAPLREAVAFLTGDLRSTGAAEKALEEADESEVTEE